MSGTGFVIRRWDRKSPSGVGDDTTCLIVIYPIPTPLLPVSLSGAADRTRIVSVCFLGPHPRLEAPGGAIRTSRWGPAN